MKLRLAGTKGLKLCLILERTSEPSDAELQESLLLFEFHLSRHLRVQRHLLVQSQQ